MRVVESGLSLNLSFGTGEATMDLVTCTTWAPLLLYVKVVFRSVQVLMR